MLEIETLFAVFGLENVTSSDTCPVTLLVLAMRNVPIVRSDILTTTVVNELPSSEMRCSEFLWINTGVSQDNLFSIITAK